MILVAPRPKVFLRPLPPKRNLRFQSQHEPAEMHVRVSLNLQMIPAAQDWIFQLHEFVIGFIYMEDKCRFGRNLFPVRQPFTANVGQSLNSTGLNVQQGVMSLAAFISFSTIFLGRKQEMCMPAR